MGIALFNLSYKSFLEPSAKRYLDYSSVARIDTKFVDFFKKSELERFFSSFNLIPIQTDHQSKVVFKVLLLSFQIEKENLTMLFLL